MSWSTWTPKKLGRIPDGGGHRAHGRASNTARGRGIGDDFVHAAVDDHSRLAYAEVLGDEQTFTCVGSGAARRRSLPPTASGAAGADRQRAWLHQRDAHRRSGERRGGHKRTRPYRPQTNGKVERFNRTLLAEWAYVQVYTSNQQRAAALDIWLHTYNHHRAHTALGGLPPISRVNNGPGSYT